MYPDLIARTCGYLGVFIALIVMGIWGEPEFAVTPQQSFDRIALSLRVLEPEAPTPTQDQSKEPQEPEEVPEPQAEPAPEPEPIPQPEKTPAPEPAEPEITPQVEPTPAPEVVPEPELTPPPTQVHTTPAQTEKPKAQPKEESKPKAPEKAVEKPKPVKPKSQPHEVKPRATTTTQNKAKPQATAAKEAPTAKAHATATATTDASANLDRQLRSQLSSLLVREIRSHLKYPRNAVRRKLEGTVMMEFEVKNGVVVGFVLRQSSGHKILDEAARKLAQKLVQFNTRLGAMNYRVQIPIKYELL